MRTAAMDGRATDDGQGTRGGAAVTVPAGARWRGSAEPLRAALGDVRSGGLARALASLTGYAALCVAAVLASLIGLVGLAGSHPATSNAILAVIRDLGAGTGAVEGPLADLVRDKQAAVLLLVGGIAATVLFSGLYLRAFRRSTRSLAQDRGDHPAGGGPMPMLARLCVAESIVLSGLGVVATGALAHAIGDAIPVSGDAVVAWDIVKWPVIVALAFVAFAALQRSAFSDPRVLASTSVASVQVVAALAWVVAITGFALYLASFGTFEDTYGTIGSGVVLLVWVTMLSMLYYVTPDMRVAAIATLGAGAALSAATWLLTWAALAVCVAMFDAVGDTAAAIATLSVFALGLWLSNVVVLLGVRLNALGVVRSADHPVVAAAAIAPSADSPRAASSRARAKLFRAVSAALQSDEAHAGKLAPVAADEEQASSLSDLELDLLDWGFTYGAAWALARAQDPDEPAASVADRALRAAREVFGLYCGENDWEDRIGGQLREVPGRPVVAAYPQPEPTHRNGRGSLDLRR